MAAVVVAFAAPVTAQPVTRLVPQQYKTIQAGIDAANPGDTVLVAPGTYVETISFRGKAITVRGRDGAAVTVIDGNHQGTVVGISGSSGTPVLEGFTITGGNGTLNQITSYGAGIYCTAASAVIRDNIIRNNACQVVAQPGSRGYGGGIYVPSGAPTITDNLITANSASSGGGGGIYCSASNGIAVIRRNTISENSGTWGGGLRVVGAVIVEENWITGNRITGSRYSSSPEGAGVTARDFVTIRDNVITGNQNYGDPATGGAGGGIYTDKATGVITGNRIAGNSAPSGGGIYASFGAVLISGNMIVDNQATNTSSSQPGGGGIHVHTADIVSNVIAGNTAQGYGGGVANHEAGRFMNNTVCHNSATRGGGGYYTWSAAPPPIVNAVFWDNTCTTSPEIGGGTLPSVTWSDVKGGWTGTGNVNVDPQFADSAGRDYHLLHGSPCATAGNASATGLPGQDFEGDPLVISGKAPMGGDARYPHLYAMGSATPGGSVAVKIVAPPGATVLWAVSLWPELLVPPLYLPGYGYLHIGAPLLLVPVGAAPASGLLVLPIGLPTAFPAPSAWPMQALLATGSPVQFQLTNAERLVVR